jgi:hypothetical protein
MKPLHPIAHPLPRGVELARQDGLAFVADAVERHDARAFHEEPSIFAFAFSSGVMRGIGSVQVLFETIVSVKWLGQRMLKKQMIVKRQLPARRNCFQAEARESTIRVRS